MNNHEGSLSERDTSMYISEISAITLGSINVSEFIYPIDFNFVIYQNYDHIIYRRYESVTTEPWRSAVSPAAAHHSIDVPVISHRIDQETTTLANATKISLQPIPSGLSTAETMVNDIVTPDAEQDQSIVVESGYSYGSYNGSYDIFGSTLDSSGIEGGSPSSGYLVSSSTAAAIANEFILSQELPEAIGDINSGRISSTDSATVYEREGGEFKPGCNGR